MLGSFGDDYEFGDVQLITPTVEPSTIASPDPKLASHSQVNENVVFETDGLLGLKFLPNVRGELCVHAINPTGLAASKPSVRPGLVLIQLNGEPIDNLAADDVLTLIRSSPRPLTMTFGDTSSPGNVRASSSVVRNIGDNDDIRSGIHMTKLARPMGAAGSLADTRLRAMQSEALSNCSSPISTVEVVAKFNFDEVAGSSTVGLRFDRHSLAVSGIAADGQAAKHPALGVVCLNGCKPERPNDPLVSLGFQ
eukprot:SAG11_NODE_206_length_12389_cov_11.831192_12_plen_251_part_00